MIDVPFHIFSLLVVYYALLELALSCLDQGLVPHLNHALSSGCLCFPRDYIWYK